MGSVIKDAFKEGRKTDIPWSKSKSKKIDVRIQTYIDNIENNSIRDSHSRIPLEQICPVSGKTLNMFNSRLEAAKWIVANVLKRPDKNPISITGNMEICMRLGYKCYGYFWRIVSEKEALEWKSGKVKQSKSNSKPVFCKYNKGGTFGAFPSIAKAALVLGVDRDTLAEKLKGGNVVKTKKARVQYYYKKPKTKVFSSVKEVREYLGVANTVTKDVFLNAKYWPNVKIKIK